MSPVFMKATNKRAKTNYKTIKTSQSARLFCNSKVLGITDRLESFISINMHARDLTYRSVNEIKKYSNYISFMVLLSESFRRASKNFLLLHSLQWGFQFGILWCRSTQGHRQDESYINKKETPQSNIHREYLSKISSLVCGSVVVIMKSSPLI